jgi:hypothetical protein
VYRADDDNRACRPFRELLLKHVGQRVGENPYQDEERRQHAAAVISTIMNTDFGSFSGTRNSFSFRPSPVFLFVIESQRNSGCR